MAKRNKVSYSATDAHDGGQTSTPGHDDGSSLGVSDVFCSLGSLIVEGRLPTEGTGPKGRGYYEGPHVELPGKISRHKCSENFYLCKKNENFRKHMLLLWQNNVPMSIEILMCSDCGVGQAKAHSLEVTSIPEPGSILLEQWTVAVQPSVNGVAQMSSLSLLQAVRSYLHFSQLSAWYSKTGGTSPWNILIRITIPGEEFESKFTQPPETHFFPAAHAGGNSTVAVAVRSLPRTDEIPKVICSHNQQPGTTIAHEEEEAKLGIAGALAWQDTSDLRRSLVKTKLASSDSLQMYPDCPGRLIKSDSMDSMLGDSLLDPPPSLSKMNPRRYQSPSRCGSPSLEAPEPLMILRKQERMKQLPTLEQNRTLKNETDVSDTRLNRHDLMRRRDLTLFHGLHPRLLHDHPKLSLPPRVAQPTPRQPISTIPCRAMTCEQQSTSSPKLLNDRLPTSCTISGKHICQFEEEIHELRPNINPNPSPNSSPSPDLNQNSCPNEYKQAELGTKQKSWTSRHERNATPYSRDSSSDSSQTDHHKIKSKSDFEHCGLNVDLSQSEMYDVLETLKPKTSPVFPPKEKHMLTRNNCHEEQMCCSKSRRSSFDEIFEPQSVKFGPKVTQVYRTELSLGENLKPIKQEKSCNLPENSGRSFKKRPEDIEIHTLKETSKYCSQDSSSSSEPSPLSPAYTQLFETEQASQTPSPASEENATRDGSTVTETFDKWFNEATKNENNSKSPSALPQLIGCDDVNVGDLCHDLKNKCLITKKPTQEDHADFTFNEYRTRSYSETANDAWNTKKDLAPLDISFEDFEESWSTIPIKPTENLDEYDQIRGDKARVSIENNNIVPSIVKKNAFKKSFDSAASMVFQSRHGLPLTSSPAPMRKGIKFDFDSGINTPKDIKRALFEAQSQQESLCGESKKKKSDPRKLLSTSAPASITGNNLLGNFEESVLNGRLEPVSTVEGFTAEVGASGSFHPKHLTFPVTVFFYTLCENSNVATPYLSHINLGKKGYRVPDRGTIQLTLFNPLGTVVKMFVVMYDLSDMPPNSQTFLRQRTLYMPSDESDSHKDAQKWLRYLIHLRLASSKSGKIYLHTDVRMIIFRKSDLDTAADHVAGKGFELRSFTRGPTNPKFSPRK